MYNVLQIKMTFKEHTLTHVIDFSSAFITRNATELK